MIGVRLYKNLVSGLVDDIPELKHYIVAVREEQFKDKIKDLTSSQMPLLLAVIPSSDGEGTRDNYSDRDNYLMFILTKRNASDKNNDTMIDDFELTQNITMAIKEKLIEIASDCTHDHHTAMEHLSVESFHIDPEYNFHGFDGWVMSFISQVY